MTAACIVPIIQHLFVLLRYHSRSLYMLVQGVLEVYFEWEVLAYVEEYRTGRGLWIDRVARGCALSMLLAHWLYVVAALLNLCLKGPGSSVGAAKAFSESLDERKAGVLSGGKLKF